jgi:hypothetical protein
MSKSYMLAIDTICQHNQDLAVLTRPIFKKDIRLGSSFCRVGYGFTLKGISRYLEQQKMKSRVYTEADSLIKDILAKEEPFSCVIDSNLFGKNGPDCGHAISLFAKKSDIGEVQVFFNDSKGSAPSLELLIEKLECISYRIFYSSLNRHEDLLASETFAITDCLAFEKDPKLIQKIGSSNALPSCLGPHVFKIVELPEEMKSLSQSSLMHVIDLQRELLASYF